MSEIDMEKRKSEILDRLANDLLQKELAEEKRIQEENERAELYQAEQKKIFASMETLLPQIVELECEKFPQFMLKVGEIFRNLSEEYDQLEAEMSAHITDFRSLRSRYDESDQNEVGALFNEVGKSWHSEELPEDLMQLLQFSFGNRDVQHFLGSWGILRFFSYQHRKPTPMGELNTKLQKR
jgi:hypothetical protein